MLAVLLEPVHLWPLADWSIKQRAAQNSRNSFAAFSINFTTKFSTTSSFRYTIVLGVKVIQGKIILLILYLGITVGADKLTSKIGWSPFDMGPYSGGISLIAVDHHGYCYAVTPLNGVYVSADQGTTWSTVNNGLSWSGLSTLFVDSSNTVYAGSFFNGLYKSTNEGVSWFRTSLSTGAQSGILLTGGVLAIGGLDTVSVSTDQGNTWASFQVDVQLGDTAILVNALAQDESGNIYAGLQRLPGNKSHPSYGGGVFISSDGGKTWQSDGLTKDSIIAIATTKLNDVFVLAKSLTGLQVYSAPSGHSAWALDMSGFSPGKIELLSNSVSGDAVAAVGGNLYLYSQFDSYWGLVSKSSTVITCLHYDPAGISYVGTVQDGIFKFSSQQSSWFQCGILPASTTAVGFDRSDNFYVGTDEGIYTPSPQSGLWYRISDGLAGGDVYEIDTVSGIKGVFATTAGGLFYSNDSGTTWITEIGSWTYGLTENSGTLYAGTTSGVIYSTDGGSYWQSDSSIGFPIPIVYSLLSSGNQVFAGTEKNGVFVTTDGGYFWSETGLSSPLMFESVTCLAATPFADLSGTGQPGISDTTIFAGTDSSGLYYSTDSGNDWTHVDGITAKDISSFLFTKNSLLVGTHDGGVFLSTDNGHDWETMIAGLSTMNVLSLAMDRQGFVYAATDSGVFKTVGPLTAIMSSYQHAPETFSLNQNYPNPFNPATIISYQLSAVSHVALKVYDLLGREVATLADGVERPGNYVVHFDGSKLASGVYFYRLVAGRHVITRKMVLVK